MYNKLGKCGGYSKKDYIQHQLMSKQYLKWKYKRDNNNHLEKILLVAKNIFTKMDCGPFIIGNKES